jgi:hypothetical protein
VRRSSTSAEGNIRQSSCIYVDTYPCRSVKYTLGRQAKCCNKLASCCNYDRSRLHHLSVERPRASERILKGWRLLSVFSICCFDGGNSRRYESRKSAEGRHDGTLVSGQLVPLLSKLLYFIRFQNKQPRRHDGTLVSVKTPMV